MLALIQMGGLGIMSITSLTGMLLSGPCNAAPLWEKYRVQVVSMRNSNGEWQPFVPGQEFSPSDLIVMAGAPDDLERFSQQ